MNKKFIILIVTFFVIFSGLFLVYSKTEFNQPPGDNYDLIVYGGEPEGVTAALAGARNGLRTLLVMEEDGPGGLMIYGALNFLDLNYDDKGRVINKGIFAEWHRLVGKNPVVEIEKAREVFIDLLLAEKNLTIAVTTRLKEVKLSDDETQIESMIFETTGISKTHDPLVARKREDFFHPAWKKVINKRKPEATLLTLKAGTIWETKARKYIDATQDADLAYLAKVSYFFGGADVGEPDRKMAATLVFRLKNIDWDKLAQDVKSQKWGYSRINSRAAWGFGNLGYSYQPKDPDLKLRGLNIALESDGSVFINALQIFNLDVLDPYSLAEGMRKAKAEMPYVVEYLRQNLAGFERAELMEYPSQLYIRESRHILTLYQLDILDLLENVDFPDKIALASYPIDYQATSPTAGGFVIFDPGIYSIPFRSLVPRNMVNLLVVGRSAGFGSLAAGSARVIPTGMATAEAAGTAAALALEKGVNFHQLAEDDDLIKELQNKLISQGVELPEISMTNKICQNKIYPEIKELISWGMVIAGYDNNLRLDQQIREREFAFFIAKGMKLKKAHNYSEYLAGGLYSISEYKPLRRDKACEILLAAGGYWLAKVNNFYLTALNDGFIPLELQESFKENRLLSRGDMYLLTAHFLKRYPVPEELMRLRTRPFGQ